MSTATAITAEDVDGYRQELIAYCYRFFGTYADAEDAVQETVLRAWQHRDRFRAEASLRTWLYSIATNACLDMRKAPSRRALPMDLSAPGEVPGSGATLPTLPAESWIGPLPGQQVAAPDDPQQAAELRDSLRLAFIATLQTLPPLQRVVFILRETLSWSAAECAELLNTTVASVNSALTRARRSIGSRHSAAPVRTEGDVRVAEAYVSAFERYDVDELVQLLSAEAVFSMPPFELWLRGRPAIQEWWSGPGAICRGSRVIPTTANGCPAVAVFHPRDDGTFGAFAIHVLEIVAGEIAAITHFMGAEVFADFGLPAELSSHGPLSS
ncbi:RNA polymerase subunit sigma-70 [Flexivirga alba]|uniref:RNA polymerase subunit sigma-70 n=1 Tax=Flexivirga alba TaxID=702742 RepID=A0ABW2ADV6_9MICO